MTYPVYTEKDSSQIYEEMASYEEEYLQEDDEERSSDHMSEMISKYGNY